jgi:hypothetical protein
MIYTRGINARLWVRNLTPANYQLPFWIAWLGALRWPLTRLNTFSQREYDALVASNAQSAERILMEHLLNDTFDPTQRRITTVTTAPGVFVVNVPVAANITGARLLRLHGLVQTYQPVGTTYTVIPYI